MNARSYFDHISNTGKPGPFDHPPVTGDTIDFPPILVTEEEITEDSMRRYFSAEERKALELIADDILGAS